MKGGLGYTELQSGSRQWTKAAKQITGNTGTLSNISYIPPKLVYREALGARCGIIFLIGLTKAHIL